VEEVLVPSWNAAPYNNTLTLRQQLEEKLRLYGKEHKRLKRELTHLQEQHHVLKLEKMAEQHAAYAFTALKEEWTFAYRQQLEKVRSQEANRYRRMLEFGLLEKGEAATYEHNLWLDELLQIEREVSPYLAFAKSAFSMALPSRRSVEFDPYRHSWDGIEFDPQTVYDRRKWMRGDVMKMLRGKVSKANAEQINCFLLDASGSMKGERMRNLFKLIYLLVLGLEGRRTFDSYHFFGSNFVEGANFSGTYTDRSILFRILRKIAKLHKWKIKYSGAGGTNISDAVRQAHGRLLTFTEEQTDKHPDTFYFKSIFVITDGVPSVGIRDEQKLGVFIEEKRAEGDVSIKGLYLKPEGDNDFEFMQEVFGSGNYVVTAQFAEAIKQLIFITSNTYKLQRKDLKYALRKAKMK
ncbi:MAG: vWA domain-containing protein, partial [Bacteroidota bacterium]